MSDESPTSNPLAVAVAKSSGTSSKAPLSKKSGPPFAKGTRLRYRGSDRLFAGYHMNPILQPAIEVTIAFTVGDHSVYAAEVEGSKYKILLSHEDKNDWNVLDAPVRSD